MFKRNWKWTLFIATLVAVFVVIINILVLSYWNKKSEVQVPNTLESLRALPYTSWTKKDADHTLSGVTRYDVARAHEGYNLYTNDADEAYLMNMKGTIIHRWKLPGIRHWEYAKLLPKGDLLAVCERQALIRLDRFSNIIWEKKGRINHDVDIYPDGTVLVPIQDTQRPYKDYDRVVFHSILHLSSSGEKVLWKWSTYNQLKRIKKYHPPHVLDWPVDIEFNSPKDNRFHYYHLNTVEILPDTPLGRRDDRFRAGNILICLRNTNLILILDATTKRIEWTWGPGILDYPHMPTMIENGNILIFDNGAHRGYSQILEINPVSYEIVWKYLDDPPDNFFTKYRGSNQRLPNGNTLICESEKGHVFEVTKEGEIVWEFWNPEIRQKKRKRIYRMMRVSKEIVDGWLVN